MKSDVVSIATGKATDQGLRGLPRKCGLINEYPD